MNAVVAISVQDGDIIVAQTNLPGIQHFGVVVVNGETVDVIHITPSKNVKREPVQEFLKTRRFMQLRRTYVSQQRILDRYETLKEAKYDVDDLNCIQFAEYLTSK